MKRWKHGFYLLLICIGYGLISLYGAYVALSKSSPALERDRKLHDVLEAADVIHERLPDSSLAVTTKDFAIWDTCGLGIYLWRSILGGEISRYNLNNGWIESSLEIQDFAIKYYLGYGFTPDQTLPPRSNLVLVINARAEELVPNAKSWLDHVLKSAYIDNIGIMLLGSETCDNDWMQPYLHQKRIKFLFIVYDSPLVDDEFVFQWPLGVASYRKFQNINQEVLDLTAHRKFVYNFIGTVYKSSSRVEMLNTVNAMTNGSIRYIKTRENWVPDEETQSMTEYQHILLQSDITLSPAGRNSECYRTYEAIELGSIPVIEDAVTEGTCDYATEDSNRNVTSPYRLLKKYNAPVIFVKKWEDELPRIIREFTDMTHRTKVRSRMNLLRWYTDFKEIMRNKFLGVVSKKFYGVS